MGDPRRRRIIQVLPASGQRIRVAALVDERGHIRAGLDERANLFTRWVDVLAWGLIEEEWWDSDDEEWAPQTEIRPLVMTEVGLCEPEELYTSGMDHWELFAHGEEPGPGWEEGVKEQLVRWHRRNDEKNERDAAQRAQAKAAQAKPC